MRMMKVACHILALYAIGGTAHAENMHLADLRELANSSSGQVMEYAQAAVVDALDNELGDTEYGETIEQLIRNVLAVVGGQKEEDGPLALASANILCRILPWTLGSKEENAKASEELYSIFVKAFPRDNKFSRFLDCAHANTTEGYFSFLKDYNDIWPESGCKYVSVPDEQEIQEILESGLLVSKELENSSGSYYRPRLALRIALLHAALAVYAVKSDDDEGGRKQFGKAHVAIGMWMSVEKLKNTRNGWRLYSDLFVLGALYGYLAGGRMEALESLETLGSNWPTVLEHEVTLGVDSDVRERIKADDRHDYVDLVHVERFLPGAMNSEKVECRRWFRYGFPTRELSAGLAACLRNVERNPLHIFDIIELDGCTASMEPIDWWLQLGAYGVEQDAFETANFLGRRFGGRIGKKLQLGKDLQFGVIEPDRGSRYFRVRTVGELTRSDIRVAQEIILDELPSWPMLVGRKKHY